jgi:hypothetical protein
MLFVTGLIGSFTLAVESTNPESRSAEEGHVARDTVGMRLRVS